MESLKKAWLARDYDGSLWFFRSEPWKDERERRMRWDSDGLYEQVEEDEETEETRKISWEDEKATEVQLVIKILSK